MQRNQSEQPSLPDVEILRIRRAGPPRTRVRSFDIDAPLPGKHLPSVTVEFSGWVAASDIPVTGVAVFCHETLLRSAPLNLLRQDVAGKIPEASPFCGFSFALSAMEVPADFELILYAVSENQPLVQLATITGRHSGQTTAPSSTLRPLMLTSLGRSGTTYFMQLLSAHPKVVADQTYPYECNAAAHWMKTFRADSALHRTPPLIKYLNTTYPALAARFCREAIEGFYTQVAHAQNHPDPIFFSEKLLNFGIGFILWNMYPNARQIFLVRDFRDVVRSVLAFNVKRGETQFGRERVASDEAYVPELRNAAKDLLANLRSRRPEDVLLVRYEDLMRQPRRTLGAVLEYLGLENSPAIVAAMIAGAAEETPDLKQHRTTPSAEASIGRWKRDLQPAIQSLCRRCFDDLLPKFGYCLDAEGNLLLPEAES